MTFADRVWAIVEPQGWVRERDKHGSKDGYYFYEPHTYEPSLFMFWISDEGWVHFPVHYIVGDSRVMKTLLAVLTEALEDAKTPV